MFGEGIPVTGVRLKESESVDVWRFLVLLSSFCLIYIPPETDPDTDLDASSLFVS